MYNLEGQVAIITGGAKGIGKGICEVFCKHGATVISWDVIDEGQLTADSIAAQGGKISFRKTDITNREDVKKAAEEAQRHDPSAVPTFQRFPSHDVLALAMLAASPSSGGGVRPPPQQSGGAISAPAPLPWVP